MRWHILFAIPLLLLVTFAAPSSRAALIDRVNEAFRTIHGRTPTQGEWAYWAGRVQRKEKTTFDALVGAVAYQKAQNGSSTTPVTVPSIAASSEFRTGSHLYPSAKNPNFLPTGTLVTSPSTAAVYYIADGKKSLVIGNVLNRWLQENHFYKHDIILTIPDSDLARYPQTRSVNPLYVGKVLQHPDGTQYFIDDKYRKRHISSPAVRSGFKMPAGNLYPTSAAHLREFATGPALTSTTKYPGGMVVYDGSYHGGRIWRIEEIAGGQLIKRLYLTDYLYEAHWNPDESHRAPADTAILARHPRGSNIDRYPDGWVVGLGANIYVVQNQSLRLIASPQLFAALGYKQQYVLTVFPEFLQRYPHGHPIGAFKSLVAGNATTKAAPKDAPNTAAHLLKVRPHIRSLISQINDIALPAYDRSLTPTENRFWVDYVYHGEVNNRADLFAAMQRAAQTGKLPGRTSRTAALSSEVLKNHWFPYLFYFVHQQEPSEAAKTYWHSRINSSDRNTIEKLGGALQWLKETEGNTHR